MTRSYNFHVEKDPGTRTKAVFVSADIVAVGLKSVLGGFWCRCHWV